MQSLYCADLSSLGGQTLGKYLTGESPGESLCCACVLCLDVHVICERDGGGTYIVLCTLLFPPNCPFSAAMGDRKKSDGRQVSSESCKRVRQLRDCART